MRIGGTTHVDTLHDHVVLDGVAVGEDLVLVTTMTRNAALVEGRQARLRLVTVGADRVSTGELPFRAIDVTYASMWKRSLLGELTFIAVRLENGTIRVGGLRSSTP